jgi:hypothetical protein
VTVKQVYRLKKGKNGVWKFPAIKHTGPIIRTIVPVLPIIVIELKLITNQSQVKNLVRFSQIARWVFKFMAFWEHNSSESDFYWLRVENFIISQKAQYCLWALDRPKLCYIPVHHRFWEVMGKATVVNDTFVLDTLILKRKS